VRRPAAEKRKVPLHGPGLSLVAQQPELGGYARIEDMNLLLLDRLEHAARLVFAHGQGNLNGLVREPQHVRRVMGARVPRVPCLPHS